MEPEKSGNLSRKSVSYLPKQSVSQNVGGRKSISSVRSMSRIRSRRMSYGFGGVPGVRPIERTSQVAIEFKRPPMVYLPTYQLDPFYKFNCAAVLKLVDESLDEHFTGHKYNETESPALAMRIAGEIMRKVKQVNYNRYRVLAIVTIAQKRSQSYNNAISFLWDYERDGYVDTHRVHTTVFIQVTVFGIYLD